MKPIPLPDITMICVDCRNYDGAVYAIQQSLKQITPARTVFFTDVDVVVDGASTQIIPKINSAEEYSEFIIKKLGIYIFTSHVLVIQHDGYVLDGSAWDPEFLKYDYIGATWNYKDGRNVGNGGFSLRSNRLHRILATDTEIEFLHPEDEAICRLYRKRLESYAIRFAPEEVANRFAYECNFPLVNTFGFHNFGHRPYKEPVIVKRTGAMGDVLMVEPVLEHLFKQGYRVMLDCLYDYAGIFDRHPYPIEHLFDVQMRGEDVSGYRVIDLDMAYETKPKQLALKSYYEAAGITDGVIRNSTVARQAPEYKMFKNYIVLHIDNTDMPHRNIHGVDWQQVVDHIEQTTHFKVFRVGKWESQDAGIYINTSTKSMLQFIVGGADYFIGLDSGVGQLAVASGVKSMIFFGSVNPEYRYAEQETIYAMQRLCPIKKDGCYHSVVSVRGIDCEVDVKTPPCISWTTEQVIDHINRFIQ